MSLISGMNELPLPNHDQGSSNKKELSEEALQTMMVSLIDDLLDNVVDKNLKVENNDSTNYLTAEEIFKPFQFDLKSALNKMPAISSPPKLSPIHQIIGNTTLVRSLNEDKLRHAIPILNQASHKTSPALKIECRMPFFNKLTKLQYDLREFEKQLEAVEIPYINFEARKSHERKQKLIPNSGIIDYEAIFPSYENNRLVSNRLKKGRKKCSSPSKGGLNTQSDESKINGLPKNDFTEIPKPRIKRPRKPKAKEVQEANGTNIEAPIIMYKNIQKTKNKVLTESSSKNKKRSPQNFHDSSDDDSSPPIPKSTALRCNYCLKTFLTARGLNTHLKRCTKVNETLSQLIDDACISIIPLNAENPPKTEVQEIDDLLCETLVKLGEGDTEAHIGKVKDEPIDEDLEAVLGTSLVKDEIKDLEIPLQEMKSLQQIVTPKLTSAPALIPLRKKIKRGKFQDINTNFFEQGRCLEFPENEEDSIKRKKIQS